MKMNKQTDGNSKLLKGTTLDIYSLLLRADEPLGIREVQRTLNLSSPSVAQYHLSKLESIGLAKHESGNYVVGKIQLENFIKIHRLLVPRYFFYSVFATTILVIELAYLKPTVITREYFFFTIATLLLALAFCYETARAWRKGSL